MYTPSVTCLEWWPGCREPNVMSAPSAMGRLPNVWRKCCLRIERMSAFFRASSTQCRGVPTRIAKTKSSGARTRNSGGVDEPFAGRRHDYHISCGIRRLRPDAPLAARGQLFIRILRS